MRLRFERLKRGWSQEHLADLVGLSQCTISFIERGERLPLPDELEALAQVLCITPPHVLLTPTVLLDEQVAAS